MIDRQSYVVQYLSLAILTVGLTTLLGTDDLLAAFICGTSFSWDGFFNKQTGIDSLFNVAAFIFVGVWMPFGNFHINMRNSLGPDLKSGDWLFLPFFILLSRRLPIIMGLHRWIPDLRTWREAAMYGPWGLPLTLCQHCGMDFCVIISRFTLHHRLVNLSSHSLSYVRLLFMDYLFQALVLGRRFILFLGPGRGRILDVGHRIGRIKQRWFL